tara:strand:+ start:34 stop:243 length:210 start_codon:yes stop_codon:yes gene_type:complete
MYQRPRIGLGLIGKPKIMTKEEIRLIDESILAYKRMIKKIKLQIKDLEEKKGGSSIRLRVKLFVLKYLT